MSSQGLAAALLGLAAAPVLPEQASALPASKGQAADVGSYLPKAGVEDFVVFTATKDMTPVFITCLNHSHPDSCFSNLI